MNVYAFDTHKFVERFKGAKTPDEQAQAVVAVIHESQRNADLATKSDLHEVRNELKGDIHEVRSELKGDIHEVRNELKGDLHEVRSELKGDLHEVRNELKLEIEGVKGELKLVKWMLALVVVAEVLPFLSELFN